jgi:hypothetical protein
VAVFVTPALAPAANAATITSMFDIPRLRIRQAGPQCDRPKPVDHHAAAPGRIDTHAHHPYGSGHPAAHRGPGRPWRPGIQSEVGFGITRLLGFDLLPRIKRINKVRLYRPAAGDPDAYPRLTPALSRPIRWDIIAEQYDQMIKYATAIRSGTASTEAILRRFTRANAIHPTYQAMIEVGRAQRTIFVARYLRDRDLQREINEGLNVVESWNRANSVIFFGKGGDIATNRRDEQELSVLCLRVLQAALVYVNTLMVQDVLADDDWAGLLTNADRRGLTPLFWTHVAPYGEVKLDMNSRLQLGTPAPAG